MLNAIWLGMIFLSVIVGAWLGRLDLVAEAVINSAKLGFEVALGLTGIMTLWLGIMGIVSASGLIKVFARMLRPIMQWLFPDVPPDHPAMGSMILNIAANMLGLANAATPFGLQAMKELQELNTRATEASDAMCTFLAINTSSVQLIPATAIAFLAANGCLYPGSVIFTSLIATLCSTVTAIVAVKYFATCSLFRIKYSETEVVDG